MHVRGMGSAADLAKRIKPAIDLIDQAAKKAAPASTPAQSSPTIDGAALAKIIGTPGEQTGAVYKITIGRPDIDRREHGAPITARMGLNTWAAFAGTDADAMVAGDVAMLEPELTPVLKALRASGLNIVATHHHMTDVKPVVIFLHYYGTGPAVKLAQSVRAAVRPARQDISKSAVSCATESDGGDGTALLPRCYPGACAGEIELHDAANSGGVGWRTR